ncbi:DUF4817 domain-containing protein [Trichonephila inaurata madagascariensis]|uniref:DUF4817 domain-containing protein n=1 Tax=Trichonephila inaurata madagascariensis TaxID=2747483 RepID=A0A8X7C7X1_9ARAC|nr:DUF4817 domain-containing protein [Trichonephila inaurata madagascariensis]
MVPTKPQNAFCAVEYVKAMSVITAQRNFWREFEVNPAEKNSIKRGHTQLMGTGCFCKGKSTERQRSEETVDRVQQSFLGVSSSLQADFHHSLHTGYQENIKKNGTFFFRRYKKHVDASMDGNGESFIYLPYHKGRLY